MSLIDISEKYFKTFSNKDLSGLEKLFADDVSLRDWEIATKGIEEVLNANKRIFESVNSIHAKPLRIYNDKSTVIAELNIFINNGEESLLVVDIIEFDSENKILEIRAYKG